MNPLIVMFGGIAYLVTLGAGLAMIFTGHSSEGVAVLSGLGTLTAFAGYFWWLDH